MQFRSPNYCRALAAPSGVTNYARVIAALAVAFLSLVVSCCVVAVPGRVRLLAQALRLWLARQQRALRLLVVVARRVDHKCPALFLSRRPVHPEARQWALADALGRDAHMLPRPSAADYRIFEFPVPYRDLAVEYSQHHPCRDSDFRPACALVAGQALPVVPRPTRG
jgi:hypothetical protein